MAFHTKQICPTFPMRKVAAVQKGTLHFPQGHLCTNEKKSHFWQRGAHYFLHENAPKSCYAQNSLLQLSLKETEGQDTRGSSCHNPQNSTVILVKRSNEKLKLIMIRQVMYRFTRLRAREARSVSYWRHYHGWYQATTNTNNQQFTWTYLCQHSQ